MSATKPPVIANPWGRLRRFTPARLALGRAGGSLPTDPHLAFQLAHARARDAVHHPLDVGRLGPILRDRGWAVITAHSAAADRATYLQRPDLGRQLDTASRERFALWRQTHDAPVDLAIVVADGLSAFAIERNAVPLLDALQPRLSAAGWRVAPLVVVAQGRVAIGDEIANALGASMVVVLIGERPGLSSPDSLGIYLTWRPGPDTTDATRNCISNVRLEGLSHDLAAHKLMYLLTEAVRRRLSGVALKDEADRPSVQLNGEAGNFLLGS
ncbi:ethanolamine ammonia-lyase subunit EutC [Nitrogeniibacter mangrovi]|uniref:Ethanolamine ammonia-lyase small subunit n=1 Tax=Nitrogeniibacter mangrovi TaxID=2016596 RepID=A0A6C1B3K1_9RHOO|nr:ethanolamine ammonia-lyase subunit EutC [Nitrogeniibacter mangrovi]QID17428.1 ethanolamine ammonia-lyase subunit EutC [Nitrogeniibacter mangrovi]